MSGFIPWEARPGWEDVTPIPQADSANPLVPINYSFEYVNAMSVFRYILSKQEYSIRVIELTAEIVKLNPAHYTVWSYRSKTLLTLYEQNADNKELLLQELSLLDELVKVHLKNYQVWQHRRIIVTALEDSSREVPFTTRALAFDSKNYHTWAYRQWALSHFFPDSAGNEAIWAGELEFSRNLLTADVRNNSAWNHRWFTMFERSAPADQNVIDREIDYVKTKLALAPNNPSAWNYFRGILDRFSLPYQAHIQWVQALKSPAEQDAPIVLAVEFLADAFSGTESAQAEKLYDKLADQLDPIRKGYWEWKKDQSGLIEAK